MAWQLPLPGTQGEGKEEEKEEQEEEQEEGKGLFGVHSFSFARRRAFRRWTTVTVEEQRECTSRERTHTYKRLGWPVSRVFYRHKTVFVISRWLQQNIKPSPRLPSAWGAVT